MVIPATDVPTLHGLMELLQWTVNTKHANTITPPPGDLLRITLL